MFHGGGNFDHWNNDETAASYDYGTAIGQAGDLRPFYYRAKRAALFARTFQAILENSTNATAVNLNAAQNVSAITARGSSAGTILFLDNNTTNTVTAVLTNGAQLQLESGEIVPIVKNAPLTSWLTAQELDARTLCIQPQGNVTTLILYGLPGETVRAQLLVTGGTPITTSPAFTVSTNNPQSYLFVTTIANGIPASHTLSAGTNTLRILVMTKTMADRTWPLSSGGINFVVCGPAYVGEFTNANGHFACTLEEPLGSALPTNILVYGPNITPLTLTVTNQIETRNPVAPTLMNWQMRLATDPAAVEFDDSAWFTTNIAPLMGADGDANAQAWYRAKVQVPTTGTYTMTFSGIKDWGTLFVNGQHVPLQSTGYTFTTPVTLQAGTNIIAIFTTHYGRNKLFDVLGTSPNGFTPKGLLGNITISMPGDTGIQLTNWYWWNTHTNTAPSTGTITQVTAINFDPVAQGWTTGTNWMSDVFNQTTGYAFFRTVLPPAPAVSHSLHFTNVDDNCTIYLNGTNVGTHNGWNTPFDISLDGAWQTNGTNILTILVQNTGGAGGLNGAVIFNSLAGATSWKLHGGVGPYDGADIVWRPLSDAAGLPVFYRTQFSYNPTRRYIAHLARRFSVDFHAGSFG